ncbi:MAG: response regulator [bacterium]|jgi:CheY-like chemotaxis protein|nr:response regulator [bacterium]
MGKIYNFLIIDDDKDDLDLLREDLVSKGHSVQACLYFAEFWDKLQNDNPNVVIIDMVNPEMPGWQVCERVSRNTGHKGVKVLLVSGILDKEDIKRMQLKADGYLTKPVSAEDVEAILEKLSD